VLHIGVSPQNFSRDWIVTCDSINFFIDPDHVAAWERTYPEKRGIHFPAARGLLWVDGIARTRHYDYDRGPDLAAAEGMLANFRAQGFDTSVWE
jgi:hypothetical protein